MTKDLIYLTKSFKVIVPSGSGASVNVIGSVVKNFEDLGFGLTKNLIQALLGSDNSFVIKFYKESIDELRRIVGEKVYKPMYPNFPKQVAEASDAELYINASLNYLGFHISDIIGDPSFQILPHYEKEQREDLTEFTKLKWIDLGSEEDFNKIFTRLIGSNSSLSSQDKLIVKWFIGNVDISNLLCEIPQKETMSFVLANVEDKSKLSSLLRTATDVLRVACAMSDGDVSLAEPTKFKNISRKNRKWLLDSLEKCKNITEDMLRWKNRWIRLGEKLHPGEFKNKFPKAYSAFSVLRNKEPFETFNSKVEKSISVNAETSVDLLKDRPGDFTRRLDHILRESNNKHYIVDEYLKVANKVSTPVLLQAWKHFDTRNISDIRAFFPKRNVSKVKLGNKLSYLDQDVCNTLSNGIRSVLINRFSSLESLGVVYLDPNLESQIVPFSQRSASKTIRSVVRGSRFKLDKPVVRFFLWWKNTDSRVDLDLSASLYRDDWSKHGDIAYYNLRDYGAYHSGDITTAPNGACEFIDIDLNIIKKQARYVVTSINSFTGQTFNELPECFGGWMSRSEPNSGEIFEPKTVQEKVDLTSTTRCAVPVVIDSYTTEVIWCDIGLKGMGAFNNASNNSGGITDIGKAITNINKPTLYDLFSMHVEARGNKVYKNEKFKFGVFDGNVTAFDTDIIASEYLV